MATNGDEERKAAPPGGSPDDVQVAPRSAASAKLPTGPNPEKRSNFLSYLFFAYMGPILAAGNRRTLHPEDLWPLHPADQAVPLKQLLVREWKEQQTKPKPSLFKAVLKVMGWRVYVMVGLEATFRGMWILSPLLLEQMIKFISDPDAPDSDGYTIAAFLFVVPFISALCSSHNYHNATRAWQHTKVAITTVVFEKALNVSGVSAKVGGDSSGRMLQLMETDAERIGQIVIGLNQAWLVPIQITVIIVLLAETLGTATLSGLAVMLLMLPMMAIVFVAVLKMENRRIKIAGNRVKLQGEVLHGIRVVKFYAWEKAFMHRMGLFRDKETVLLRKMNFVKSLIVMMFMMLPLLVGLASFGTFLALDGVLTAPVVFKSLALFNALRFPLIALPSSAQTIVTGLVSLARVEAFLQRPDLEPTKPCPSQTADVPAMIENGTFAWSKAKDVAEADSATPAANTGAGSGTNAAEPVVKPNETNPDEVAVQVTGEGSKPAADGAEEPAGHPVRNVNFRAVAGSLTAVVGSVGSGKSSLLSCLMGEMQTISGDAHIIAKRVGFVAQTAWIQNLSLRDNVLFGEPYDKQRYDAVIAACALKDDLEILPQADLTEIGDRGINLSGGQKQRVALARAVYAQPDVLLFDDPLSAVDANVGEHIFNNCINGGITQGATRILVTNQLHLLPQCSNIYVMKEGQVVEHGTYQELMAAGGELVSLVRRNAEEEEAAAAEADADLGSDDEIVDDKSVADEEPAVSSQIGFGEEGLRARSLSNASRTEGSDGETRPRTRSRSRSRARTRSRGPSGGTRMRTKSQIAKEAGNIIEEEESEEGAVALGVYWHHFKMMGGVPMLLLLTFFVVLTQLSIVAADYWLAYWTDSELPFTDGHQGKSDGFYLSWYAALIAIAAVGLIMRGLAFAIGGYWASKNHHRAVVKGVMSAPLTFFDRTPTGRVLNRFLKDTNSVDSALPTLLENTWSVFAILIGNLVAVAVATPLFIIPLVVIVATLWAVQRYYKSTALSMQRIEATTRSPVVSHFTEVLGGAATIRSFRAQKRFIVENMDRVTLNMQAFWMMRLTFRWAVTRIEILNACSSFFAALFIVLAKGTLAPSFAGAALNFALSSGGIIGFSVILATDLEIRMNAVERLRHYGNNLLKEKAWEVEGSVPDTWPSQGKVDFEMVQMKYRAKLEPALNNFSAHIDDKEKIGVAGRTGSGKSTLMMSLFRMYELSHGEIRIDGVDISKIGLHQLRRKLAIIPQDPVLFSGTIRSNLDPFQEFADDELKLVLGQCQLAHAILVKKQGLDTPVEEYGKNFSQGEAQLICMGRALLRKPKILVMDEATSSVDARTDRVLQDMIKTQFSSSTVIAIAHRLNTIMNSDRVIVMEDGRRKEFDTPINLCRMEGGVFRGMAEAHGITVGANGELVYDEEGGHGATAAGIGAGAVVAGVVE